jgi:hypothetical protein
MSDLSCTDGYRASSYDSLLGCLDELADRVSREAREQKRILDVVGEEFEMALKVPFNALKRMWSGR